MTDAIDSIGARYYSSQLGRFMTPDWSEDPEPVPYADLSNPQSLNLYAYAGNNPVTNTDADGHLCCFSWLKGFFGGLANSTITPVFNIVRHPVVTAEALGNSVMHPIATIHGVQSGVVTVTQQIGKGDPSAIGAAVGTVGAMFIPGAGEADDATDAANLARQLTSDEQLAQVSSGAGKAIIGAGTGADLRDAARLAQQYGGEPGDWVKVTSDSSATHGATTPGGSNFEVHAYQNTKTGQVVEMKTKIGN